MCVCVYSEITECGQLRLQSVSKASGWWGGFGGCPTVAGRLVEIKQLKIDRHSEEFKDCSEKVFMRGCLKIVCMAALETHKCKKKRKNKKLSQHVTQSLGKVRMW